MAADLLAVQKNEYDIFLQVCEPDGGEICKLLRSLKNAEKILKGVHTHGYRCYSLTIDGP